MTESGGLEGSSAHVQYSRVALFSPAAHSCGSVVEPPRALCGRTRGAVSARVGREAAGCPTRPAPREAASEVPLAQGELAPWAPGRPGEVRALGRAVCGGGALRVPARSETLCSPWAG